MLYNVYTCWKNQQRIGFSFQHDDWISGWIIGLVAWSLAQNKYKKNDKQLKCLGLEYNPMKLLISPHY